MQASPWTISPRKFEKLGSLGQHRLLAELARTALVEMRALDDFHERYAALHELASLDRFRPPFWLTRPEALEEYAAFHQARCGRGEHPPSEDAPKLAWQPQFAVTVALDQVRSPYNIGSILRLIDNFGLERLVHASAWLETSHPRLVHAARGCERWIPLERVADLPAWLERLDRPVIAIDEGQGALDLADWEPPSSMVLLLGNETYGLSAAVRARARQTVRIPNFGYKNSMNVSHAFAVVAQRVVEKLRQRCE